MKNHIMKKNNLEGKLLKINRMKPHINFDTPLYFVLTLGTHKYLPSGFRINIIHVIYLIRYLFKLYN